MPVIETLLLERPEQGVAAVDVVDDVDRFRDLRTEWIDLLGNSSANNPFLSWEWLYAWWTNLGAPRRLQILTARTESGRLIGVVPLCASRGRWPWLSQLEFLATGWAGSDYLDLIVRRGYEDECTDAFSGWLRSRGQTVRFDHLRPAAFAATLGDQLISSGWGRESARSGICPFAALHGHSWESYVETLRPSQRTRCRRYLNTLRHKFAVNFARVTTESERHEVLSALMGFHDQRWTPRGGSTAFQTPALRAFHHDVTSRALDAGWLRLFSLRVNDDIAAVTYCFQSNERFYLYQHGFNPRFWQYSVGVVVLGLTIRSAIEERASEFDMLYGEEPYKALWASETRQLDRIELFPPDLRGRIYRRTMDAERSMRMLARRIFPRKPCDSNVPPAGVAS
jgi:CelD/BcsL family acetyltransferase involved in cellulose biosynthesis